MAERSLLRRVARPFASVRARTTLVGVVVVAAALTAGAFGLIQLLRASMTEGVETTARTQLNDVVSLLQVGQLPEQLPAGRGDTFTQVVTADGRVLATSATRLAATPISHLDPGEDGQVINTIPALDDSDRGRSPDSEGPYLLLAQRFDGTPGQGGHRPVIVYVAATLHPVETATDTVGLALTGGLPVLVLLVGALIWMFVGRALRPVEAIRAEVADITGNDLHRRVPEPGTRDEVALLARTMNEMLDRLETAAAAQERFVADASHELRSPLAAIQATLEVAVAHPARAAWPDVAADALSDAKRLRRLIDDLLLLARAGRSEVADRLAEVDLDEIVLREARLSRAESRVTLDLRRMSAGRVLGDVDQLTRVVHNLLDNAQRHATKRVAVELTQDHDRVVLAIEDDGPGIPPAERDRIFERFARLDEARNQDSGGTGLGLALAKEIVTGHGGVIEALDGAHGARFEVRLPAVDRPDPVPLPT